MRARRRRTRPTAGARARKPARVAPRRCHGYAAHQAPPDRRRRGAGEPETPCQNTTPPRQPLDKLGGFAPPSFDSPYGNKIIITKSVAFHSLIFINHV
jgi:hypothetical protein